MSCYLKEDEIEKYCGLTEGVTMAHVNAASYFIDSYKGCSYDVVRREERIEINKKGRGKIRHFPFAGIEKITARMESPFGESPVVLSENCIDFDSDDSPYFTFYMPTEHDLSKRVSCYPGKREEGMWNPCLQYSANGGYASMEVP